MAEELADALSLAEVHIIPAGQPPHRGTPRTPAHQRLEMARLAIERNPRFVIDDREIRQTGASYTVDTLTSIRSEIGTQRPLWLLMGTDAFLGLTTWKHWRGLFELAHIAVAHRPGYTILQSDVLHPELRQEIEGRGEIAPQEPCGRIAFLPVTALDISATAIRNALQAGSSVRYLTPAAVIDYIQQHHLYPA